jgi:hypothetical protein
MKKQKPKKLPFSSQNKNRKDNPKDTPAQERAERKRGIKT